MKEKAPRASSDLQDGELLEHFRLLLRFSDAPVAIYNRSEHTIYDANEAACALMSVSRTALRHTPPDTIVRNLNVVLPPGTATINEALDRNQAFQIHDIGSGNTTRTFSVHANHATPYNHAYVIFTAHDITGIHAYQESAAKSQHREQDQSAMLTELADDAVFTQGSLSEIFDVALAAISNVLKPGYVDAWLRHRDNNTYYSGLGNSPSIALNTQMPEVRELLQQLHNLVAFHVENTSNDPRIRSLVETLWPERINYSVVFYPIHTAGILGSILAIWRPISDPWEHDEISFFSNVGGYVGQGLRNFLGRRNLNDAASMSGMIMNMLSTPALDTAITEISKTASQVIGGNNIAIFLIDPDPGTPIHVTSHTLTEKHLTQLRSTLSQYLSHADILASMSIGKPLMIYRETEPPESHDTNPILDPDFQQALIMPMVNDHNVRGGIVALYRTPRHFMVGEMNLLETLAQQSVSALEITRLVFEQREYQSHLNLLFRLNQLNVRTLDRKEIAQNALEDICRTFDASFGILAIRESPNDTIDFLASFGIEDEHRELFRQRTGNNVGFVERTIAMNRTYIIDDTLKDPDWSDIAELGGRGSWISVPLEVAHNTIASITLAHQQTGYFTDKHEKLIKSAGGPLSTALAYAQLIANEHAKLEAERRESALAEGAQQAMDVLTAGLDVDQVLDRVMDAVVRVVDADTYNIILIEEDHGRIVRSQGYTFLDNESENLEYARIPVFEFDNFKRMIRTGEPVIIADTANDPNWVSGDSTRRGRAYIGVSIRVGDETVGFINASSFKLDRFSIEDARKLTLFAGYVALAMRNVRIFQQTSSYAANLEQRIISRTRELELRTSWAEAMLNSTSDGIIIMDSGYNQIQRNNVAKRLFEQTLSHIDLRILMTAMDDLVRQKLPAETQINLTGMALELKASDVEDETEPAIIVTIHDITHLRAMDRIRSQFVSDVSHELRTPIATISLYANLIRKYVDPQQTAYLDALNEELASLTRMVESILLVSRFEADRKNIAPQLVNLNIVVAGAASAFESAALSKGLQFTVELSEYPIDTYIDVSAFKYVINHILDNAIAYTDEGQITISTALSHITDRKWAILKVKDTGIGIPKEEQHFVFERFYRGEVTRQRQISGSGMGLALAQIITRQHGGHITITSEVGQGSEFCVYLPAEQF